MLCLLDGSHSTVNYEFRATFYLIVLCHLRSLKALENLYPKRVKSALLFSLNEVIKHLN